MKNKQKQRFLTFNNNLREKENKGKIIAEKIVFTIIKCYFYSFYYKILQK